MISLAVAIKNLSGSYLVDLTGLFASSTKLLPNKLYVASFLLNKKKYLTSFWQRRQTRTVTWTL